jgi:lantibiotic modifying enzyme
MHQENMIAIGDHPVPIDLETILQAEEQKAEACESQAFEAAAEVLLNSVMMVGLLPAYGRSPDTKVFAIGGMTADWNIKTTITWSNINSDTMRPVKSKEVGTTNPNLPHVDGRYARLADHIEDVISGFGDYARFLLRQNRQWPTGLFEGFARLPARRVIRPTRFYAMLLQRLKNHRTMDDGAIWSAQADFATRLAEWAEDSDPLWPLQRAERTALTALNVPHFVSPSDGTEIGDASGIAIRTGQISGLDRARARVQRFDAREIAWQIEVIRANTNSVAKSAGPSADPEKVKAALRVEPTTRPTTSTFRAEADRIATELSRYAIRRGPGAAWIGLDWL